MFYNIKPGISIRFAKWLNTDYTFDADYIETFIEKEKKSKLSLLKHVLDIFVFPAKNQMLSLRSEYYLHENENNLFVDLMYRFTITKRNFDIELRWNNVFNGKRYIIYQANAFNVLESNYLIRPSQLLLSVKFGF